MFNEILTGKASLEPTRPAVTVIPEVHGVIDLVCGSCQRTFTSNNGTAPKLCPACNFAMVEANTRESAAARAAAYDRQRRDERSGRILRVVIVLAIAICIGLFKYGMQKAYDEDMRTAHGGR